MNRFMIGQHGCFDEKKYERDFRRGFYGIEACLLREEKDVDRLLELAAEEGFNIGVHFPLRGWANRVRDPLFFIQDENKRREFYGQMEDELCYLKRVKPKYVLFHYPKPVILDDNVDWSYWRFGDNCEYIKESAYSFEELREQSEVLFQWLTDKAAEYDFVPVLEFDALNRYVYATDLLEGLLEKHPRIRVCLDIARLHLQDRIDRSFDFRDIIRRFAKYAEVIHVSTVKAKENLENNHFPALPTLDPAEGWADMAEYMRLIREENCTAKLLFEHRSDLISDDELEACYNWIAQLLQE